MFFIECERLAERNPDLAVAVQKIDSHFRGMRTAEVIRVGDLSSFLGLDPNQTSAVLEGLATAEVLVAEKMVECAHCGMAVLQSDYHEMLEEHDEYRCTSCHRLWKNGRVRAVTTFRRGKKWPDHPPDSAYAGQLVEPTENILSEGQGEAVPSQVHCRTITSEGLKELNKDQYERLVSERKTYDIFIDGFTREVLCNAKARPKLTPAEFAIICDYIEAKTAMRPLSTNTGKGRSREAANKLFTNARTKVDTRVKRYEYRAFRTHKATVPAMKSFQFDPPEGLTYCLIIPNTL